MCWRCFTIVFFFNFDIAAFNVPTVINVATVPSYADVEVYLNGERKTFGTDWFFNSLGITADQDDDTADITNVTADSATVSGTGVVYFNTRPANGDGIAIVVKVGHDYIIEGSNLVLTSFGSYFLSHLSCPLWR